ncbi:MAG: PqqD family protein [Clostridiaceae bacterium]
MSTIEMNDIYQISEGVKSREESFGLLIVSKTTPAMSLNHDAKTVWELIDGVKNVSDIITLVAQKYESNDVQDNVVEILNGFLQIKLITQKL